MPEVYEFCREKGGSSFVRDLVDRALAPRAANNKALPLGFDPINEAEFVRARRRARPYDRIA